MMGATEFNRMSTQSLFVNTSRGKTYDLKALYNALKSGRLLGAGIDVFQPEPLPREHPILQLPNVICTPHIAICTVERQYAINRAQFANCQRVLAGEPPQNLV
jgi:phosphoglycerate dehydrogenase-like enzyme